MSPSTFGSYEISRSGMNVSERSLYVTGQNLSNATTAGYVRQQAVIAFSRYTTNNPKYQYGLGAEVQETRQMRHAFMDITYRNENSALGYWETRSKTYDDIQTILGDPDMNAEDDDTDIKGLQNVMNQFWDSWQELSKDPSSLSIRALVRQRGQTLVDQINHIGSQLDDLQKNLDAELVTRINEVNDITKQIAQLNMQIVKNEGAGDHANDYRDQRNLLVDRLTKLAKVDAWEMPGGALEVSICGHVIVNQGDVTNLTASSSSAVNKEFHMLRFEGSDVDLDINTGIIGALIAARGSELDVPGKTPASDCAIPSDSKDISVTGLKQMLNDLIRNMADRINAQHTSGTNLLNATGQNFFVQINSDADGMRMGNIKLDDAIINDLDSIAASGGGGDGDNTIARIIANLRNDSFLGPANGTLSIDDFYNSTILGVGNAAQEASNSAESQNILVSSADNNRKSIMDVSMDEEMSNMMKFQYSYSASSRVLNAIDGMIETIISRMGLVGR